MEYNVKMSIKSLKCINFDDVSYLPYYFKVLFIYLNIRLKVRGMYYFLFLLFILKWSVGNYFSISATERNYS